MKKLMNSLIFVLFQGFIFAIEPVEPVDPVSELLKKQVEKAKELAKQQEEYPSGSFKSGSRTPSDSGTGFDAGKENNDDDDEFTEDTGFHLDKKGENNGDKSKFQAEIKSKGWYGTFERIINQMDGVRQSSDNIRAVQEAMNVIDEQVVKDTHLEKAPVSGHIDNLHNANGGKSFSVLGWIKDFINKLLGNKISMQEYRETFEDAAEQIKKDLQGTGDNYKKSVVNLMITKLYREYERDFNSVVPNFSKSDLKAKYQKAVLQTESLANQILGEDGIAQDTPEWYMMKIMKINWANYK